MFYRKELYKSFTSLKSLTCINLKSLALKPKLKLLNNEFYLQNTMG